jgi:hypothetical protein
METKTATTTAVVSSKKADSVVISLNREQIVNVLFNVLGVTFIGADTTTVPDMNIGGRQHLNYMHGNVVKDSEIRCMLGFDYEKRQDSVASKQWVKNAVDAAIAAGIDPEILKSSMTRMKEYSTQSIEKFVAKERKWGKHMINPDTGKVSRIMIHHTKKDKKTQELLPETYARYMQVEILGAKSPVYRYKDSGEVLSDKDLDCVKLYLKPRKDEAIAIRDYSIENIKNIRINKQSYRVTD